MIWLLYGSTALAEISLFHALVTGKMRIFSASAFVALHVARLSVAPVSVVTDVD